MPGKLADYRRKRDFAQTPEPKGAVAARNRSLRFVVQKHAARSLHYDFRLELDGTLKSWAIPKGPSLDPAQKRLAVHVEDHPLEYGNFEGVIPPGHYGAGKVEIWDSGVWQPLGNAADDYRAGKLKFRLDGEKLHGGWALVRTRLPASGDKEQWLLIKERDGTARPADEFNVTEAMPDAAHATVARKSRAIDNAAAGSRRPKTAGAAKVKAGSPNAKSGQVPVASKRASAKPARRTVRGARVSVAAQGCGERRGSQRIRGRGHDHSSAANHRRGLWLHQACAQRAITSGLRRGYCRIWPIARWHWCAARLACKASCFSRSMRNT
jgi:bifunctional non-homologous end joining protein LigD